MQVFAENDNIEEMLAKVLDQGARKKKGAKSKDLVSHGYSTWKSHSCSFSRFPVNPEDLAINLVSVPRI